MFKRLELRLAFLCAISSQLVVSCGDDPVEQTLTPTITTFSANPTMVAMGGTSMLTYAVRDAESVRIDIMGGANVLAATSDLDQTITSPALTTNTTFVLTATNKDKTATRSVTVMVEGQQMRAMISSFAANPMTVDPGMSSTLSWTTVNASSGAIRVGGTEIYSIPAAELASGSFQVDNITAQTTYTLAVKGPDDFEVTDTVVVQLTGPMISSFTASPPAITVGESTTLAWAVTNATMITVNGPTSGEVYSGAEGMSGVTVSPAATETFTLVASGAGGQMATQNVTVTVNPIQTAVINSFTASPSMVDIGVISQLAWDVTNATGGIEISSGGTVLHTDTAATGTFDVQPAVTTTYDLRAINPNGDDTDSVTVTVNPTAPFIVSFTATPALVGIGANTQLDWATIGATGVRVRADGTLIYTSSSATDMGTLTGTVTQEVTNYTLEAVNDDGTNTFTVRVVGHNLPVINAFTVLPNLVTSGSTVTVSWDVSSANELELFADGTAVATFPPVMTGTTAGAHAGSLTVTLASPTVFELVARSAAGEVRATQRAGLVVPETEPNDDATTAIALPGDGGGVSGDLTAGDEDWYSFTVPAGGMVIAETSDGNGGCTTDTVLTLYNTDGTTTILSNNDISFPANPCSRISGRTSVSARNLAAGTYYLAVTHDDETAGTGTYSLSVLVLAPACGNGYVETRAAPGEQCDDANTVDNDGCSATCTAEAQGVVTGPNVNMDFTGGIAVAGENDFYQVVMQAEGYIRVETFVPARPGCNADTVVALYDSAFVSLGEDDDDGVSNCSLVNPLVDAFAHVQAGTYWVGVRAFSASATIPAYTLAINTLPFGCGNGIIENTEECDDGNNVDGDGCSVSCTFEGTSENEVGGNNVATGPGVITVTIDTLFSGVIDPLADVDFYAVTVPQGYHLDAFATVNSLDSCPVGGPRARLRLFDTNGTTVLATNTAGGPNANCGRISPATTVEAFEMAAGTYYIAVNEVGDDALIGTYYLHVAIIAPGCANGILEGTEQCDDGNTTSADGCSATCTIEPQGTYSAPGPLVTFNGAITPVGNIDYYQIDVVGAPVYIEAETFVDATAMTCTGADTVIRLLDSVFDELGNDDEDGVGSCSLIRRSDAFARVDPGTYYLSVEDYLNNGEIAAYALVIESFPVDVCGNGVVELVEACDDGNVTAGDGCSATCTIEPLGVYVSGTPEATFPGAITPIGDLDYFQIDVVGNAVYVDIETFAPTAASGLCTGTDTVIRLLDSTYTELGNDDEGGVGSCSRIGPDLYTFARLDPGTYFVSVEDYLNNGTIAAYEIVIGSRPVDVCGNGIVDGAETCDDSNTTAGDGCSATCTLEINPMIITPPGGVVNVTLPTGTSFATIEVHTAAPGQAITVTATDPGGACDVVDTGLNLGNSAFELLGQSLGNGPAGAAGTCASIRYPNEAYAANLAIGTYYVLVFAQNGVAGPIELNIGVVSPVCGNAFVDSAAGEECDDGNMSDGDGCSAACILEVAVTPEVEPNNTLAESQSSGLAAIGNVQLTGAVTPTGDRDYFSFVVPPGPNLTLTANTYLSAGNTASACPDASGVDTRIRLRDSADVELAQNDDINGGANRCSSVTQSLAPGTYHVVVEYWLHGSGTVPFYFLNIQLAP